MDAMLVLKSFIRKFLSKKSYFFLIFFFYIFHKNDIKTFTK